MAKKYFDIDISEVTNTIYLGKKEEGKSDRWANGFDKIDVTDVAIRSVFLWFLAHIKNKDTQSFVVSYPDIEMELIMQKKKGLK